MTTALALELRLTSDNCEGAAQRARIPAAVAGCLIGACATTGSGLSWPLRQKHYRWHLTRLHLLDEKNQACRNEESQQKQQKQQQQQQPQKRKKKKAPMLLYQLLSHQQSRFGRQTRVTRMDSGCAEKED